MVQIVRSCLHLTSGAVIWALKFRLSEPPWKNVVAGAAAILRAIAHSSEIFVQQIFFPDCFKLPQTRLPRGPDGCGGFAGFDLFL